MTEPCPECETDLLVAGAQRPYYRWKCHGCNTRWGEHPTEPIAYDAVDRWYEPRSPQGVRLHTDRDCPTSTAFLVHTPTEAQERRHGRCQLCGHEVVDS